MLAAKYIDARRRHGRIRRLILVDDDRPAPPVAVEPMAPGDWEAVRRIFVEGVATGDATFESQAPEREAWERSHFAEPRLVARDRGSVLAWAALSPVSARAVYRGVAEVSVYVSAAARGRGVGTSLLAELVRRSEEAGLWTLQAGIFPENEASLALHRRCGFRVVGIRERMGQLAGSWRNVLLLERRSDRVGAAKGRDA